MTYSIESIDLRTDPRTAMLLEGDTPRRYCEYVADFVANYDRYGKTLDEYNRNGKPSMKEWRNHPLRESLMVRDRKAFPNRLPDWMTAVCEAEDFFLLLRSIVEDGYRRDSAVQIEARDGGYRFYDGTHRACILLVLGLPIKAQLLTWINHASTFSQS